MNMITICRRYGAALIIGLAAAAGSAQAQNYPSKPVKMIVGFAPGGPIDVVGRIIAERLTSKLGKPFIVENRTGANGILAAEAVASAEPDGHTILVSNSTSITLNPTLYKKLSYNPERDFAPISTVISSALILIVNPENPISANIKSLSDFVALAKSKPGEISFGSAGNGNITHIGFELLSDKAGIKLLHIPYRGTAASEMAVLSKDVITAMDTLSAVQMIQTGKLRALAVTSPERLPALPDVPTVAELGYPGFEVTFWSGLLVPKATPAAIVELLNKEIIAAGNDPEVRKRLEVHGSVLTLSPDMFSRKIQKETKELADIVAKANISIE